ncbi:hypothetical protein D3C75_611550 [compost metagenome]
MLHLRPARLEVQGRITHLEEQADAAGFRRDAMVQRALVLEVAFVHRAFDDCTAQPFVEGGAEHLGQVLGGVAAIAFGQADAQVHVVLAALFEQQANEEVTGDLALLAEHLEVRRDQGETFLVQGPGQARIGLLVVPGFGEDRVQVQHERIGIKAQFAMAKVTADAAADVTGCRSIVIGIETDLLQVGFELQALVTLGLGPGLQAHIAQSAGYLQAIDHGHDLVRQRRQGIDQRGQRREVEAVGLHLPAFRGSVLAWTLLQLQVRLPTGLADIHGQGVDHHIEALLPALEPGAQGQVVQFGRLAPGIGALQLRCIEAYDGLLQLPLAPVDPELAARPQGVGMPLAQQAWRQPTRPVTLWQAQVGFDLAVAPGVGRGTTAQVQRQGLAIGQGRAQVQGMARSSGLQADAHISQGQRVALPGVQGDLAVEHIDAAQLAQALQQLGGVERRIVLLRQAFEAPGALLVLTQDQLQAAQLNACQAYLAGSEAGPDIGYHLDVVQAQGRGPLAQLQVAHPQHRCQAAPAAFQGTDVHGQAQSLFGLALHIGAVLGHQRHQFAAEADIQRHQYRQQGASAQPPAGQGDKNAGQTSHGHGPPGRLSMMARRPGFASPGHPRRVSEGLRAAPHRIVPANTSTPPGNEWFGR